MSHCWNFSRPGWMGLLATWSSGSGPYPRQRSWNQVMFKVSSNPSNSVILQFYDSMKRLPQIHIADELTSWHYCHVSKSAWDSLCPELHLFSSLDISLSFLSILSFPCIQGLHSMNTSSWKRIMEFLMTLRHCLTFFQKYLHVKNYEHF